MVSFLHTEGAGMMKNKNVCQTEKRGMDVCASGGKTNGQTGHASGRKYGLVSMQEVGRQCKWMGERNVHAGGKGREHAFSCKWGT